jgi:sugar O-acyltransferase (sialic acid O-acetyltransferase NeuD family)
MKNVVLFGTGDFAQVAYVYLSQDSEFKVVAFTAHQEFITEPSVLGLPVVPFEQLKALYPPETHAMFVAIGFKGVNRRRAEMYDLCKSEGYELISYVNSKAIHWGNIEMGDNCFIFEANVIQPFVKIGSNVIIWSGNHIGHHSIIGDNCFIASHAVISGRVKIGNNCFVGVNATLRDGVVVAPECVIGAGAVILKDTVEKGVYRGPNTEPAPYKSNELRGF